VSGDVKGLFVDDGSDPIDDARPAHRRRRRFRTIPVLGLSSHPDDRRHFGCPVWWARAAFSVTRGGSEFIVALYLWRLREVKCSRTVNVPNGWLKSAFGIHASTKYRALCRLAEAGLVRIGRRGKETLKVTLPR
jgi:hypothetical protein